VTNDSPIVITMIKIENSPSLQTDPSGPFVVDLGLPELARLAGQPTVYLATLCPSLCLGNGWLSVSMLLSFCVWNHTLVSFLLYKIKCFIVTFPHMYIMCFDLIHLLITVPCPSFPSPGPFHQIVLCLDTCLFVFHIERK
jgi:hypothetical protein